MPGLEYILGIDARLAVFLNGFAAVPSTFNHLVLGLTGADEIKMGPFIVITAWFWNRPPIAAHRQIILRGMAGIFIAFFSGRIFQVGLLPRVRPVHEAALGLHLPYMMPPDMLGGWSSFPSDHGAIFAAAVCLAFALSRPIGVLATLHVALIVLLPRLYVGVHYLSDVLGGCLIGVAGALLALKGWPGVWLGKGGVRLAERQPALFYMFAMLFMVELAEMFHEAREYASVLHAVLLGKY